ncbi:MULTISPECIES: lipoprotein LpqH [Mycobacterium]|uniref:Lipoprotein LpqH n=1 Tax=Mycobacterium kiyosense TaxID=2871094 RepID=A0A9P3Q3N7_9MYCO|nr:MULTISPECIES: lipoprotein LpqH [Mycobacterium]BDB44319.1 hypothetical protein IWGMT90018_47650 [Mycobacterium kiyosense]BDE15845.1 hypothetical protein MKCMC460_47050 [Mycobacterium sp. 20KCMC460]GLB80761.1 hypothetical protein SRL2020028_00170 [Mycobacterium kiyosense]GLB87501.1 hypothetical protein SRL2020130_03180 [Mycobacterium kiyosense]GLB93241.1 hypothetical protein SRL2020226_00170 [Mycobacterium kiyosense]
MKNRFALVAAAAVLVGSSAACSSAVAAKRTPGTLDPGTARLTIDGSELPLIRTVECAPPEQHLTTVSLGDNDSGATLMVSNAGKLTVEFVRIRNLNGFSGDYNRGLADLHATVEMTENTYQITGEARGYGPKSPEPTTVPFTMKLSC